jgi:hypothetical protein
MNGLKILTFLLIAVGFATIFVANFFELSDSPAQHHLRAALLSLVGTAVFVVAFFVNKRSKRRRDV